MTTLETIMVEQYELQCAVDKASSKLNTYPKGAMGMVPHDIMMGDDYAMDKANFDKAFSALRKFNSKLDNKTKRAMARIRRGR